MAPSFLTAPFIASSTCWRIISSFRRAISFSLRVEFREERLHPVLQALQSVLSSLATARAVPSILLLWRPRPCP